MDMAAKSCMKEFYKRVLVWMVLASMVDVAKTGACVSMRQHFAGTLSVIARDLGWVRSLWHETSDSSKGPSADSLKAIQRLGIRV